MVQEGVYTFESINDAVAEPVVYMLDHFVMGGFYRVHTGRGTDENLNAPGMHFVPLAFESACLPEPFGAPNCMPNRFYAYGVIARSPCWPPPGAGAHGTQPRAPARPSRVIRRSREAVPTVQR